MITKPHTHQANAKLIQRIEILDYLRGGAMLLVFIQHCHILSSEILAFHMPLFFILSGYIFKYKENNGICYKGTNMFEYARKRFYRIMAPYFCFEFISFILAFSIHHLFEFLHLGNVYMNIDLKAAIIDSITCIQTPSYMGIIPHLWFFPCIYIVDLLFIFIKKYFNVNVIFIMLGSLLVSLSTQFLPFRLPFTIDTAFMGLFFLHIGYYFKYFIDKILNVYKGGTKFILSAILSIPIFLYLVINNDNFLMFANKYGNYLYAIPAALLGIYIYLVLIVLLKQYNLLPIRLFSFLSRNSLLLFPLHLMFMSIYNKVFEFSKIDYLVQEGVIRSWVTLILVVLSVLLTTPFINKNFPILTGNYIPQK